MELAWKPPDLVLEWNDFCAEEQCFIAWNDEMKDCSIGSTALLEVEKSTCRRVKKEKEN